MTKIITILTITILLTGVIALGFSNASVSATSNIVVNGSFEEPSASCPAGFVTLFSGSTVITGWTVGGNGIDWICTGFWDASEGTRSLDLSHLSAGSISQDLSTDVGTTYKVDFDMAGNPAAGATIKSMTVSAADDSETFTFDITGKSFPNNMGYEPRTFFFVATDTTTTLTFTSNTFDPFGPVLDNVSAENFPEPEGKNNSCDALDKASEKGKGQKRGLDRAKSNNNC